MPPVIAALPAMIAAGVGFGVKFGIAAGIAMGIASGILSVGAYYLSRPPDRRDLGSQVLARKHLIRSASQPQQVIYGQCMVSGTLAFPGASTGDANQYLHLIVALAGHECEEIGDVYFDDILSTDARFTGLVRINKHLGSPNQEADADLVSEITEWTENHRLRGICYLSVRLTWDPNVWMHGVPNIRAVVKGRKLYDPRTETTAWSNNAALCGLDYLLSEYQNEPVTLADDIHLASWIAAANTSDEDVALAAGGTQKRYTVDGAFNCDRQPPDVLEQMETAMAGKIIELDGRWHGFAGAYTTPTFALDADDLRGEISAVTTPARRDRVNIVRGTFVDAAHQWQATDFPQVTNAAYVTEDGEDLPLDIELPFTTDPIRAQRIAKIILERSRRGTACQFPAKLVALPIHCRDTGRVTIEPLGFDEKVFVVADATFAEDFGIDLSLREEDADIYAWDAEETVLDEPAEIASTDPYNPPAPTNVVASSGSATYVLTGDGTTIPRIRLDWDAITDRFVLDGGRIEMQYRIASSGAYIDVQPLNGDATYGYTGWVGVGVSYDLRVRTVNIRNVASAWTTVTGHTCGADTAAPAVPGGVTVTALTQALTLTWNPFSEKDWDGVEIHMSTTNDSSTATVVETIKSLEKTIPNLATGTPYYFWLKSYDRSGNKSAFHATQYNGATGTPL